MRKWIAWLLCILLCAPPALPAARAYSVTTVTLRILEEDAVLYKNPSASPANALFVMTKGYFAVATDYDENFWQVNYQFNENGYVTIFGYLLKEDAVLYTDPRPDIIYPDFEARALFNNTFFYESCTGTEVIGAVVKGQTAKCYGFWTAGEEVFVYARCGNLLGYLPASKVELTDIPEHPIPLPREEEPEPEPEPGEDVEPEPRDDKLQILLILAIVIPSLVIIYVMLRPKKKRF